MWGLVGSLHVLQYAMQGVRKDGRGQQMQPMPGNFLLFGRLSKAGLGQAQDVLSASGKQAEVQGSLFLLFSFFSFSLLSIAKALEIAILGRASPTVCESLEMLSRCFKESAGAKDPALARLQSVLQR